MEELKEKLLKKIRKEEDKKVLELDCPPDYMRVKNSYKLVAIDRIKEELKKRIKANEFTEDELNTILSCTNVLDTCYEWYSKSSCTNFEDAILDATNAGVCEILKDFNKYFVRKQKQTGEEM